MKLFIHFVQKLRESKRILCTLILRLILHFHPVTFSLFDIVFVGYLLFFFVVHWVLSTDVRKQKMKRQDFIKSSFFTTRQDSVQFYPGTLLFFWFLFQSLILNNSHYRNVTIQRLKPSPTPVFVTLKCASLSSLSHVNYSLILFVTIVLIFCIKCFFE